MKTTLLMPAVLCLFLAACTSEEAPPPTAAPAPAAQEAGTVGAFEASQRAYQAAEKACRGCPNETACQQALMAALKLTTAALQNATGGGEDDVARLQRETEEITQQFDGLAALSNECL